MPKIKTHSGAKKRFSLTAKGKVKGNPAFHNHILNKKTTKLKRSFRKQKYAAPSNEAQLKRLIPYA